MGHGIAARRRLGRDQQPGARIGRQRAAMRRQPRQQRQRRAIGIGLNRDPGHERRAGFGVQRAKAGMTHGPQQLPRQRARLIIGRAKGIGGHGNLMRAGLCAAFCPCARGKLKPADISVNFLQIALSSSQLFYKFIVVKKRFTRNTELY